VHFPTHATGNASQLSEFLVNGIPNRHRKDQHDADFETVTPPTYTGNAPHPFASQRANTSTVTNYVRVMTDRWY
jgi:hypothetical protein